MILTATRNARSPEYVATLRRKLADKIRSLVSGLAQEADRPDFAVATHPIVAAIRRALEQLSDAEFEGNAREILRQIRDSMMNGGWEKYRDTHVRDIAVQGARLLSTKDEVGPSHVGIKKRFANLFNVARTHFVFRR